MTEQKMGFDLEAMRRGIEGRDADLLISLYADDAELRIVNKSTPPRSPRELHGKEEIAEYLREGYGMEMEHRVENAVFSEDRVAFNIACRYPDGLRVLVATTLKVRDGKIAREVDVEAWDE
jgi:ketosteroid isomerase-like protein